MATYVPVRALTETLPLQNLELNEPVVMGASVHFTPSSLTYLFPSDQFTNSLPLKTTFAAQLFPGSSS